MGGLTNKEQEIGRADRLWLAIQHLKQELRLGKSPNDAAVERAHWLLDRYETELFEILAKHQLRPEEYGYPERFG